MLKHAWKRIHRTPLPAVAVLLFAAILCTVLCGLEGANRKEVEEFREIYRTTPVTLTVTNLTGTKTDGLEAPAWVANVFSGDTLLPHSLKEYVKDLRLRTSYAVDSVVLEEKVIDTEQMQLVGVTSEAVIGSQSPLPGNTKVTWLDGYDESAFLSGARICLLPESMVGDGELPETVHMEFSYIKWVDVNAYIILYYALDLTVAGTHSTDYLSFYCPYYVVAEIYNGLEQRTKLDCVSAVLIDNDLQAEAAEHARYWFPEPDLAGKKIPWDYSSYTYYPYALRIDDSQLRSAEETLENSLTINRICTALVFALSAGAGFLISFLMIRSRKREIILMRTMGTPNGRIYGGFAFEQLLCIVLGAVLGGSAFRWQPAEQLATFVGIYFGGLTVALLIFLHSNLISNIKEDE